MQGLYSWEESAQNAADLVQLCYFINSHTHCYLMSMSLPQIHPSISAIRRMSDDNGIFALIISEMVPLVDLLQDFKILSDTTTAKARENI
jgi:hypothetical protein